MPSPTSGTGNQPKNGAIDTDTKYADSAMAPSRAAWPAGDEKERGATAAAASARPATNARNGDTATHIVKICSTSATGSSGSGRLQPAMARTTATRSANVFHGSATPDRTTRMEAAIANDV